MVNVARPEGRLSNDEAGDEAGDAAGEDVEDDDKSWAMASSHHGGPAPPIVRSSGMLDQIGRVGTEGK
jgi:hypothetical protein